MSDKFIVLSDLHFEFNELPLSESAPEGISGVLVAGDVATKGRSVKRLEAIAKWAGVPVVFTPGNHDYYGSDMVKCHAAFQNDSAASDFDIRYLNPGVTVIGSTRIIAATLWTDYRLRYPDGDNFWAKNACENIMNDHKRIRLGGGIYRPIRASDLAVLHHQHRNFIAETAKLPHDGPTIVMTHHAPSPRSIAFKEKEEMVDHAYASNLDDLILEIGVDAWIHGHTHNPESYSLGKTLVFANPRGSADLVKTFSLTRGIEIDKDLLRPSEFTSDSSEPHI